MAKYTALEDIRAARSTESSIIIMITIPNYYHQLQSTMDSSLSAAHQSSALKVDFAWSKFKALISDVSDPESKPLYIVGFQMLRPPHLTFKSGESDTTVGTGTLHAIDISPDYELHGFKGTIKAQKRLKTSYTHQSRAYSETGSPVTMAWTSHSGFKTWDFVCMDENQIAVAKFAANMWGVKKVGQIEFLGPKANDSAVRDEIVVTGVTLFYCMWLRVNNVFNLVGSIFLRPDHDKKESASNGEEHAAC
ncbi:hypothetical protein N7474_001985 [Penicillium riverlandense]|uniref:uncharacterized protein n=1 Tax=Penicillium riverlandense TaxID=1903569 RepID=UPI002547C1CC|nr:uncharacterized protein N7474_001985 [Penicillium riverlandense]KAJ5833674.1 hypothetical protein N7474_001985 [Penicillium riverlandense]